MVICISSHQVIQGLTFAHATFRHSRARWGLSPWGEKKLQKINYNTKLRDRQISSKRFLKKYCQTNDKRWTNENETPDGREVSKH